MNVCMHIFRHAPQSHEMHTLVARAVTSAWPFPLSAAGVRSFTVIDAGGGGVNRQRDPSCDLVLVIARRSRWWQVFHKEFVQQREEAFWGLVESYMGIFIELVYSLTITEKGTYIFCLSFHSSSLVNLIQVNMSLQSAFWPTDTGIVVCSSVDADIGIKHTCIYFQRRMNKGTDCFLEIPVAGWLDITVMNSWWSLKNSACGFSWFKKKKKWYRIVFLR